MTRGMASGAQVMASLSNVANPGQRIEFQYNPTSIKLSKQVKTDNPGKARYVREEQLIEEGRIGFSCSKVRFDGSRSIRTVVDLLFAWLEPDEVPGAAPAGAEDAAAGKQVSVIPKTLRFSYGGELGVDLKVVLKKVDVEYLRFSAAGVPLRAEVSLQLEETVLGPLPNQNPTSGSVVGGRVTPVVAGDTLQGFANDHYGDPNAWRALADANGVDDPLRVRPGAELLLPETY